MSCSIRRSVVNAAVLAVAIGGLGVSSTWAQAPDPEALAKNARVIVQQFNEKYHASIDELLQDGVRRALSEYVASITDIGSEVTENTNFDLARVSLKPRASEHEPDAWEKAQFDALAQKKAQGAAIDTLESFALTTTQEGLKIFRYFKPVVAEERCLGCHGKDLDPDLKRDLAADYPEDKATGYSVGDIIGAISMVQPAE